jgi:hypothetical protein
MIDLIKITTMGQALAYAGPKSVPMLPTTFYT